jgi:hypothetical protein
VFTLLSSRLTPLLPLNAQLFLPLSLPLHLHRQIKTKIISSLVNHLQHTYIPSHDPLHSHITRPRRLATKTAKDGLSKRLAPHPDIESNNEQTRLVTVTDRQVDFKVHTSTDLFVALSTVGKSNSNFLDWHRKASRGRSEAIGVLCTSFIFKVYSLMTAGACSCHPIVAPSLLLHPPWAYNIPLTSQSHHLNIPQCRQHDF